MELRKGDIVTLLEHPCYKERAFNIINIKKDTALVTNKFIGHIFYWPLNKLKKVEK